MIVTLDRYFQVVSKVSAKKIKSAEDKIYVGQVLPGCIQCFSEEDKISRGQRSVSSHLLMFLQVGIGETLNLIWSNGRDIHSFSQVGLAVLSFFADNFHKYTFSLR